MIIFELMLWTSLGVIAYGYVGYPILLGLVSILVSKKVVRDAISPSVSVILTVHNEIRTIRAKINNMLLLEYPERKREIIIVSDASMDGTDDVVRMFASPGLRLLVMEERKGKEMCQQKAIDVARGEILVFTDAGVLMPSDALLNLIRNFADPSIGCVSSTDPIEGEDKSSAGESLYLRYEMMLRNLESSVGSLVGLSGSCFASRRELCYGFQDGVPSDFIVMLNSVRNGMRGVSDEDVKVLYQTSLDPSREFSRKVRTIVRGMTGLWYNSDMLNPFRWGFFSIQLWSHKLIRWLVPLFLLIFLGTNSILAVDSYFFQILLLLQCIFYVMAILGLTSANIRRFVLVRISTFFVLVNASIIISWWKFLKGDRILKWEPTHR